VSSFSASQHPDARTALACTGVGGIPIPCLSGFPLRNSQGLHCPTPSRCALCIFHLPFFSARNLDIMFSGLDSTAPRHHGGSHPCDIGSCLVAEGWPAFSVTSGPVQAPPSRVRVTWSPSFNSLSFRAFVCWPPISPSLGLPCAQSSFGLVHHKSPSLALVPIKSPMTPSDPILSQPSSVASPRKRTMSFSSPQPASKSTRPIRRTGSYLSLSDMQQADNHYHQALRQVYSPTYTSAESSKFVPYTRSSRHYQKDRRKSVARPFPNSTLVIQPPPPMYSPKPVKVPTSPRPRTSSPLSPTPTVLPPRTSFPRSKQEPDLYKVAITTRMRMTQEGQKILHMGARLAISIFAATQELERIVAAQTDRDRDVIMSNGEAQMSTSWVVVPHEDWEMVDCGA